MSNQSVTKDDRSRNWCIVFYPDSAPSDFESVIRGFCVNCFLSPLHCDDVNADGSLKKPHYHLLLMFSGKKSVSQIQELSDFLSGTRVIPYECAVRDCRAMARYLIHLDNPDKHQYSRSDVKSFGSVDYLEYIETSADISAMLRDITAFCVDNCVDSLVHLQMYCIANRMDWFRVISSHTVYICSLINSIHWCLQHGRKEFVFCSTGEVLAFPDDAFFPAGSSPEDR